MRIKIGTLSNLMKQVTVYNELIIILKIYFIVLVLSMHACLHGGMFTCVQISREIRGIRYPGAGGIGSCQTRELQTELGFSGRAESPLNCQVIFFSPDLTILK